MAFRVTMYRTDEHNRNTLYKEYLTKIPIEVIIQLTLIEKRDWLLFRDSGYNMFGEFIYRNLSRYPSLKGHIQRNNYRFEFIYEYITDHSQVLNTTYYHNDSKISKEQYLLFTSHKYYSEHWTIIDPVSPKAFIFFQCEYSGKPAPKDHLA